MEGKKSEEDVENAFLIYIFIVPLICVMEFVRDNVPRYLISIMVFVHTLFQYFIPLITEY